MASLTSKPNLSISTATHLLGQPIIPGLGEPYVSRTIHAVERKKTITTTTADHRRPRTPFKTFMVDRPSNCELEFESIDSPLLPKLHAQQASPTAVEERRWETCLAGTRARVEAERREVLLRRVEAEQRALRAKLKAVQQALRAEVKAERQQAALQAKKKKAKEREMAHRAEIEATAKSFCEMCAELVFRAEEEERRAAIEEMEKESEKKKEKPREKRLLGFPCLPARKDAQLHVSEKMPMVISPEASAEMWRGFLRGERWCYRRVLDDGVAMRRCARGGWCD